MTRLKKFNHIRRKLMRSLTANIGKQDRFLSSGFFEKKQIKKILVIRPNHRLGNLLLITPLLQELEKTFPESKIDVFLKGGLGPIVLKEYKNTNQIIALPKKHFHDLPGYIYTWSKLLTKKYDLAINVVSSSSSGRLATKWSRSAHKIFGDERPLSEDCKHMGKHPVCHLREILNHPELHQSAIPTLNLKLSNKEISEGKEYLQKLTGTHKKILAIYTYATGDKCYSKSWWDTFYNTLQKEFPGYFILEILPKENVSQIDFKAATFYSRDLRKIGAIIANTALFIGADSGMMHLAVASGAPVIGLFSVTKMEGYKPYGGKNMAIDTTKTSIEQCMSYIQNILE